MGISFLSKKRYIVDVKIMLDGKLIQTVETPVDAYNRWQAERIANAWAHKNIKIGQITVHKEKNRGK
jgi:hypothetical protein